MSGAVPDGVAGAAGTYPARWFGLGLPLARVSSTEHDCVGIDALVLPGHRAAKNFFEESGFTARALVMHHKPTTTEVDQSETTP